MLLQNKIEKIKEGILGKKYSLSVGFADEKRSQEINKKYRRKDRPTNVLSFALREGQGELVFCKKVIQREAKELGKKYEDWLFFLVIHGLLHLKGYDHGKEMEKAEEIYSKKYLSRTKLIK